MYTKLQEKKVKIKIQKTNKVHAIVKIFLSISVYRCSESSIRIVYVLIYMPFAYNSAFYFVSLLDTFFIFYLMLISYVYDD